LELDIKGGLVWYRKDPTPGAGAGVYRWGSRSRCSFSFGLNTTVFQAEMYAIKACVMENIEEGYAGISVVFQTIRQL
jgi:hypothetical protein